MEFITYVKSEVYDNSKKTKKEKWKYTVVSFFYYIWNDVVLLEDGSW